MRRSRRVDEIPPQPVEDNEDNALHVDLSDSIMIVITTDAHRAHDPATMAPSPSGRPFYDRAARVDQLLGAVRRLGLPTTPAPDHGVAPIAAVHDAGYLHFLETVFERWQETPLAGPAVRAFGYAVRQMQRRPDAILGQAGYYLSGETVPVLRGTWPAAKASAHVATEGAKRILGGAREAYALCRPSGHHVYVDLAGGFCYLNNAAIAAQVLVDGGAKPAVLDVDVHHGNGTQGILYERDDVYFCSVHGDPRGLYPWYAGYVDETGAGKGIGCNLNLPLAARTDNTGYVEVVETGLEAIAKFGASALIISLGFDAHDGDPTANLAVTGEGFRAIGHRIGSLGLPTLLVQEGGYIVENLGDNLTAFLDGFLPTR
jgi:acetoin utilization deacetylase AcuC-like enzyme